MLLEIATGLSAKSKSWKNKKIEWSKLVETLRETTFTNETLADFLKATKEEQLKIKDVGGFVGGYLRSGRRNPSNVVYRQLLTLDLDFAKADLWFDFTILFDCAAVLHSTHKHSSENPRFRLIIPLDREVTGDEYVAIARKVAGDIGINLFDNTTFETNRLMFWPSTPKDQQYYFEQQDGPFLSADEILNSYSDWKDSTLWPTATKVIEELRNTALKQADPLEKAGLIGAFCRAYTIHEAIATFLNDEYKQIDESRYTYTKGSTAGGLVTYDDKFSYSHHGTDPTSGQLCNAFDLVRVHKFDHLGHEKSTREMENICRKDDRVKLQIAQESISSARFDFGVEVKEAESNLDWAKDLEVDARGNYLSNSVNINLILANDPNLKERFKHNIFDSKNYVFKNLPWRTVSTPEPIIDVDFSGVRNYIEVVYGISSSLKVEDSLKLEFRRNCFHPVKDYLSSLKWDKQQRIDNLLIDYFGAIDNVYTRESIRKMLVGAVARIFEPGIKFDLVLTLVGAQGTGKSTFLKKLGKSWFSDTFLTVHGKDALEQIQGCWLIEIAELAGLRKADVEATKQFITKQEDIFRPAYGHVAETFKRQCVFFATTNDDGFLKEDGNRRFMPVDVNPALVSKDVFSAEFENEIDQIWAEAMQLYKAGEQLYLSKAANEIANFERRKHTEVDERAGLIEQFLDRKLPEKWDDFDVDGRKLLLQQPEPAEGKKRQVVCIFEVWCECLGNKQTDANRYNTKDINQILKSLPGWEACNSTKNFSIYGKQRYFKRK